MLALYDSWQYLTKTRCQNTKKDENRGLIPHYTLLHIDIQVVHYARQNITVSKFKQSIMLFVLEPYSEV